ncbi:MAG: GatB/YqeY domain-containing protein [Bradymonadales bacterium]|jgi:uncharacterized protein YqeY
MTTINDVHEQIVAAMKSKDARRRDALRLILNALKVAEKEARAELTAEAEVEVLSREAKKRREAMESYEAAGRAERVAQERYELGLIQEFLPKAFSESEVRAKIAELVQSLEVKSKKQAGLVMKNLSPILKGRFDGRQAKALVDDALKDLD